MRKVLTRKVPARKVLPRKVLPRKVLTVLNIKNLVLTVRRRRQGKENIALDRVVRLG